MHSQSIGGHLRVEAAQLERSRRTTSVWVETRLRRISVSRMSPSTGAASGRDIGDAGAAAWEVLVRADDTCRNRRRRSRRRGGEAGHLLLELQRQPFVVAVLEGDPGAAGLGDAGVAGRGGAAVPAWAITGAAGRDRRGRRAGAVGRAVVDDDELEVGEGLAQDALDAAAIEPARL